MVRYEKQVNDGVFSWVEMKKKVMSDGDGGECDCDGECGGVGGDGGECDGGGECGGEWWW